MLVLFRSAMNQKKKQDSILHKAKVKQEQMKMVLKKVYTLDPFSKRDDSEYEKQFKEAAYKVMQEMMRYSTQEETKGNIGPIVSKIIMKTGSKTS